jgi:quercetin dioxygenase-like cupin family protein
MGDKSVMRLTLEPGWRWSEHVKPTVGTQSCDIEHFGYCISGRLRVRMDDGTEGEMRSGDVDMIPAGHDAWVVGDEPFVGLDFISASIYGKPKK